MYGSIHVCLGWIPYFALLGGIVTELGGFLSHSAVVAREYRLPAVVGVIGAMEFFKSGETIVLDAERGVVAKQRFVDGKENEPPQIKYQVDPISQDDAKIRTVGLMEVDTAKNETDPHSTEAPVTTPANTSAPLVRRPSETPL